MGSVVSVDCVGECGEETQVRAVMRLTTLTC